MPGRRGWCVPTPTLSSVHFFWGGTFSPLPRASWKVHIRPRDPGACTITKSVMRMHPPSDIVRTESLHGAIATHAYALRADCRQLREWMETGQHQLIMDTESFCGCGCAWMETQLYCFIRCLCFHSRYTKKLIQVHCAQWNWSQWINHWTNHSLNIDYTGFGSQCGLRIF